MTTAYIFRIIIAIVVSYIIIAAAIWLFSRGKKKA